MFKKISKWFACLLICCGLNFGTINTVNSINSYHPQVVRAANVKQQKPTKQNAKLSPLQKITLKAKQHKSSIVIGLIVFIIMCLVLNGSDNKKE